MGSGPTASLGPGRRCARHALAAGPDGQCALCRSESLPPPQSYPTLMLGGLLAAILLVSGGVVAYRAVTSLAHAAIAQEPSPSRRAASGKAEAPNVAPPGASPEAEATLPGAHAAPLTEAAASPATDPAAPPPEIQAAPGQPAPTQAELQAALSATPIVMYGTTWCGVCRQARQFMADNGLQYREIDADATPGAWDKIQQLTGRRAVPVIIVDGELTPAGLSPSNVMRAVSRSVERRLGVRGIRVQST
jgi:mycoredoxin